MNNIKNPIQEKTELIQSKEFEDALMKAANVKKEVMTVCKDRNKNNYIHFYDVMLMSRTDIQSILSMKKKNRSSEDNDKLKDFKKETSRQYKKVCELLTAAEALEDPDNDEPENNTIVKMVKKVADVVQMMDYIGNHAIEKEFKKYGIELKFKKLDEKDSFANESVKEDIKVTLDTGKRIRQDIELNKAQIKSEIYSEVPIDLQFNKENNPTGIKGADFCKLVDIQTKMLMAQDDEQKEKVEDSANKIAGDYEFANVRNKILQSKLVSLKSSEDD